MKREHSFLGWPPHTAVANVLLDETGGLASASGGRRGSLLRLLTRKCMLALCALPAILQLTPPAAAQRIAHIDQPMASPTFINIYWDSVWDADNPTMTKARVDAITQAIVASPYWAGLAEYGVKSASFAGGFLPEQNCPSKPPNLVGFYPGIADFIQCEHDSGPPIFRQPGVVYNIILPQYAKESDFWTANMCNGPGSPIAWHYHGLEHNLFGGDPPFTIVMANPQCLNTAGLSGLFENLTHEMVEAATDPNPFDLSIIPPRFSASMEDEIADPLFNCSPASFPVSSTFVMVSSYWSNAQQKCVSGPSTLPRPVRSPVWESLGAQSGDVSTVSWGYGRLDLFTQDANNVINHKYYDGNWKPSMTAWESLGRPGPSGGRVGKVSAVSWGYGRLDLFVRGADDMIYHKWFDGSSWGPSMTTWELLGGLTLDDVTAVSWGYGRLDVFIRRPDNAILHKYYGGNHWMAGWESLGGATLGPVTAVSWGSGRLDLFVRDTNNVIKHKWFDGNWGPSLTTWESLGGATLGNVSAVSWGPGRLDLFVRGTDNGIYHKWFGGSWGPSLAGWESLGGATAFDPRAVSWGSGRLDVLVRGTDNAVYHKWYDGNWGPSISTWESLGGGLTLGPVSPVSWGSGRLDLFAPGTDKMIDHRYFDGIWRP